MSSRPQEVGIKLGRILKSGRATAALTLRDVERRTGISNGYLSQLETGSVRQPSPVHLEKLASLYQLPYPMLMDAAGYATTSRSATEAVGARDIVGVEDLELDDLKKIQAYVDDLRAARSARARGSVR